jgi:putative transcriptional regulator
LEAAFKNRSGQENLMAKYAAGSLGQGMAVLMASYVTLSSEARQRLSNLESLHGVLLDEAEPVSVSNDMLYKLQARLDDKLYAETTSAASDADTYGDSDIPAPLRAVLGQSIDETRWRFAYPGVRQMSLPIGDRGEEVKLLKIKPGNAAPRHSHNGVEATLVLRGAFSDGKKLFERGDLAIANEDIHHRPRAQGDEDCICLAVTDGALFFEQGVLGMVRDLFTR